MKICARIRRKLKSRHGFTLAEVLMAVLILLMVSSVVAGGVPVAANAYYKVVDAANAQMLLSTTVTKLRRELAFASDVYPKSGVVESYTNGESGQISKPISDDTGIKLEWGDDDDKHQEPLVREAAATKGMYAAFDRIIFDQDTGFFKIQNLRVQKDGYNNPLASVQELQIRAIGIRNS